MLRENELLARHTSWRVGGPARQYFEPEDRAALSAFVAGLPATEPILWMGLGSNLLVRDGGFPGTVIALHGALEELRLDVSRDARRVYAEAGVHCARLAKFSIGEKLAGGGFLAGVPGTIGGALAMNAGAHGGETWNWVCEAEVMFRDGSTRWLARDAFRYAYRHVELPDAMAGFVAARFAFADDTDGSAERDMKEWLAKRRATQPVGKPTAGSTFRNPPGDHAARLIEHCGLKGFRLGTATVSTLHANFIITDESARAADVEALIHHIQHVVADRCGVHLQPEVRIVGEPGEKS